MKRHNDDRMIQSIEEGLKMEKPKSKSYAITNFYGASIILHVRARAHLARQFCLIFESEIQKA